MNKQGMTLIELLAVIGILSILALITTPVILNVISNSRKDAWVDSAYGLIDSARDYRINAIANKVSRTLSINYTTNSNVSLLKTTGKLPDAGNLNMDKDGTIELAVWSSSARICVSKKKAEEKVNIKTGVTKANCNTDYMATH